jgi:MFS family permease
MTLPGLIGLFISFVVGPLALRFKKEHLLMITAGSNMISMIAFGIFGTSGPFIILLLAAGFSGLTRGAAIALMNSTIGQYIGAERSAPYIAISAAIMNGCSAFIGVIGSMIAAVNGGAHWNRAFYLGFLILPTMIVYAVMMSKVPNTPALPHEGPADSHGAPDGTDTGGMQNAASKRGIPVRVFAIIALTLVFMVSFAVFILNISAYIITEYQLGSSADVGMITAVSTVSGLIIGFTYKIWAKLLGNWIVPIGFAVATIGLFVMMTVHTTIMGAYVASTLIGISLNLTNPFIMSHIMKLTPPRLIPVSMSLSTVGMNLGFFLTPYVLSLLGRFMGGGFGDTFLMGVIFASISTVAAVVLFPISMRRREGSG